MIGDVPRREQTGAVAAQVGVISALFIREMLTRVGRSRLGILWLMAEPIILSSLISLLHWLSGSDLPNGLPVFLFYALGYVPFMMFRSIVNRGAHAIHANISLLHHSRITLLDVMVSRNLMEAMVCSTVIALYMVIATLFMGEPPHQPALFIFGLTLSALLAHGLAMVLASAQVVWEWVEHLVHPFTYLMLPISASFFMLDMMPQETRELLLWNPLVHVHEMNRWAMFGDRVTPYYDVSYVLLWIIMLNLLGMAGLRVARVRLSISD
ncbi:ABC transporter permease [Teichococcus coralli]